MSRGDHGGRVFLDRQDYELFLARTEEVCRRTGWAVHSYVLMPNHFHWLVETPEANLVAGMKWFLGAYSQGFNARHGQRGHVFQGRYKALPVESGGGSYFETVSTYIHLNPARAGLLKAERPSLAEYAWSSYPAYTLKVKDRPSWLNTRRVLSSLGLEDTWEGRRRYAEYIAGRLCELRTRSGRRMNKEIWDQIRRGWCIGGEEFQEKILERVGARMEGKERDSFSGQETDRHGEKEAEKLLRKGLRAIGVREDALRGMRKGAIEKIVLAWRIHCSALVTHKWICERLSMGSASNLTMYIRQCKNATDGRLLKLRMVLERL